MEAPWEHRQSHKTGTATVAERAGASLGINSVEARLAPHSEKKSTSPSALREHSEVYFTVVVGYIYYDQ